MCIFKYTDNKTTVKLTKPTLYFHIIVVKIGYNKLICSRFKSIACYSL